MSSVNNVYDTNQYIHQNNIHNKKSPIQLPSWITRRHTGTCSTNNNRISTHSPDEYSKKIIEQCSKQIPPQHQHQTTTKACDVMRLSKDCWFDQNNDQLKDDVWRQLPRPERWRWRQNSFIHNHTASSTNSLIIEKKIDIHNKTTVSCEDDHNNGGDTSSCCYNGNRSGSGDSSSGRGKGGDTRGVKRRRNGLKTTRSAVSSYLKVRRRDSNTSALTIFSICEQLCRLNNHLNKKGNRKESSLISSSIRNKKPKRNILPISHFDEYLFTIVQKAWNTPTTTTSTTITNQRHQNQTFQHLLKHFKMNKDDLTATTHQSTGITTTTTNNTIEMNDNSKITSTSSPTWSPILTRRRLSVPEIIMRKYALTRSSRSRTNSNNSEESLSSLLPIEKHTTMTYNNQINNNPNKCPLSPNHRHIWNINDRTSGSDGDLSTLLHSSRAVTRSGHTGGARNNIRASCIVDNNTSQIHKSTLLRRFWSKEKELQRNHSVDVIYSSSSALSPTFTKKLSPTRFSQQRLRENVLLNNSIRREKFSSTSDLNDNHLSLRVQHSSLSVSRGCGGTNTTNSTPNISTILEPHHHQHEERSLCCSSNVTTANNMDRLSSIGDYHHYNNNNTENHTNDNNHVLLLPEKIENISKNIVGYDDKTINVLTGSVYKPIEADTNDTLIPRYSAIPRTQSMEVEIDRTPTPITSGAEQSSTEYHTSAAEDSDEIISLVDSLEDATSPRLLHQTYRKNVSVPDPTANDNSPSKQKNKNYDNKLVRGDIIVPLINDQVQEQVQNTTTSPLSPRKKGDAFFLDIDNDSISNVDDKIIANRLPKSIQEKIHQRQTIIAQHKQKRQQQQSFHVISSSTSTALSLQLMDSFKIDSHGNMKILTTNNNVVNKENNWIKRSEANQQQQNNNFRQHRFNDLKNKSDVTITPIITTGVDNNNPQQQSRNVVNQANKIVPTFVTPQQPQKRSINVDQHVIKQSNKIVPTFVAPQQQKTTAINNNNNNTRRIYQKIDNDQNNEKKIEIVDVIECTTNDNADDKYVPTTTKNTDDDNLKRKCTNNKLFKSKIPIPVLPTQQQSLPSTSTSYCLDCNESGEHEQDSENNIRLDQKPINIMRAVVAPSIISENNSNVDRLIAGILINNINDTTKTTIKHQQFETIPEEDNIENKNKDMNKNQKLYRTHVTLIMSKTPEQQQCNDNITITTTTANNEQQQTQCSCNCNNKRDVKNVGTNTDSIKKNIGTSTTTTVIKPTITRTRTNIVKDIGVNTIDKKNIVKHSCIIKPTNNKKVVNKTIQTINMCDSGTQTIQQQQQDKIVSKQTQTIEATSSSSTSLIIPINKTTRTTTINQQHGQDCLVNKIVSTETQTNEQTSSSTSLIIPLKQTKTTTTTINHQHNNDEVYQLKLDHQENICDHEHKIVHQQHGGESSCESTTTTAAEVAPVVIKKGLQNDTNFIDKLNKYRRTLRNTSVPVPMPIYEEQSDSSVLLHHHHHLDNDNDNDDKRKLQIYDNDSEFGNCGNDSENATTITATTTNTNANHHKKQHKVSSVLSLNKKQQHKRYHQHYQHKFDQNNCHDKKKNNLCGWSITVSGTNNNDSKITPDLKMRLKFPTTYGKMQQQIDKRQSDSDIIPQTTTHHIPKNKFKFPCLPNVNKINQKQQSRAITTKPTKTLNIDRTITTKENISRNKRGINSIRYRPSGLRQMKSSTGKWLYTEEIKYIDPPAGSLAVLGSTISPEQKPKVMTMSERDLSWRLLHTPNSLYNRY
ncbi:probable serine/threonine-protein kinase DDB_G0282963 [Chrysoperla carnea]|uniref:probable serine/threonine-protein kinase DDB_G0282963 n=1 Tax=Chrysoperla carnea TaxID=189513 RepID=UPI001D061B73|nr:probable serine/threonine-protein kinase DDB_G0282963 [Chrysoperla carnea]